MKHADAQGKSSGTFRAVKRFDSVGCPSDRRMMTIHDILVGIDASAAGERLLRSALGLAREHKAYLAAAYCMAEDHGATLLARAPVNPSPGIFVAPEVLTAPGVPAADLFPQISHEAQIADRVQHLFCNELQREGLDGEWHLLPSNTVGFLDLAKSFDLTILGQLSPEGRSIGFPPGETVVASGRPVLVIPYAETIDKFGRRALIAWDGTREAVRAVHGALPLLDRAEAVMVIYVGAQQASLEQHRPSLEWISSHLKRHRIPAQPEATLRGALSISEALLSRAADMSADLIVSGAYHHSQLREALIGGVSRNLMEQMTVPVLFSH
jgi:nucleotide-binding universal stress UspA family protein